MEMLMQVRSEHLIEQLEKLLENELIVGYTTSGKPLTLKGYNQRLEKAEKQLHDGKLTSQEDLEAESDKW